MKDKTEEICGKFNVYSRELQCYFYTCIRVFYDGATYMHRLRGLNKHRTVHLASLNVDQRAENEERRILGESIRIETRVGNMHQYMCQCVFRHVLAHI